MEAPPWLRSTVTLSVEREAGSVVVMRQLTGTWKSNGGTRVCVSVCVRAESAFGVCVRGVGGR